MIDMEPRRTLAYIRVSTEHQELDRQRDMINRYSVAYGADIDKWLEDEGISGRASATKGKKRKTGADMAYYAALCSDNFLTSCERPGFLALLQSIQDGGYKRVIVAALDRLSRDMVELMLLSSKLDQWDCELIVVDSGGAMTTEDASGWMQYAIKSVFAEYECRQTGDRTKQGMAARRAAGKRLGRASSGWMRSSDGKTYIPDPAEWATLADVVTLRAQGATYHEIAAEVGGIGSHQSAKRWLDSWARRSTEGFADTPETRELASTEAAAKTEKGRYPLIVDADNSFTQVKKQK